MSMLAFCDYIIEEKRGRDRDGEWGLFFLFKVVSSKLIVLLYRRFQFHSILIRQFCSCKSYKFSNLDDYFHFICYMGDSLSYLCVDFFRILHGSAVYEHFD